MKVIRHARIHADSSGESHFSDVEVGLAPVAIAPPAPPLDLSPFTPAARFAFFGVPTGWYGDWHPAPERQVIIILSGEIDIEASDGERRRFGPGSLLLVEDTTGKGHVSWPVDGEVLAALVQLAD